jgi:hypothetical protein
MGKAKIGIVSLLAVVGCDDARSPARPGALLTDETTQNIISAADIQSMNGTYAGCEDRTGSWSMVVAGTPVLDYDELSVINGDVDCQLAITEVRTGTDLLTASAPLLLTTTYGPARSFGNPIEFYATAAVGSVSFTADFTISLLFSEQPRNADETLIARFATVTGSSASATGVPAPNYTLDTSGAIVTTDIAGVTVAVLNNVALTAGSNLGDFYVIVSSAVGDSYAAINTAYLAGTPAAVTASIPASAFLAPGVSLASGAVRTLIIAKITDGIASYQKFNITFSTPS